MALDVFEGPLDLLLRLIERQELDITKVSLALVADQYLAHIALLRQLSAAHLADFLVIAAKLLVIKSRALLPPPEAPDEEEEEEDLGEQLAQQLREYKRFKEVCAQLRQIEESGRRAYPRLAPLPKIEPRLRPGEASLDELVAALRRALAAHPQLPAVDSVVSPVVARVADWMQTISALVQRYHRVRFSTVMRRARSRLEVIVTFLALLELIKQQRVRALQEQPFGEIYIEEREPDPEAAPPPTDLSEYGEESPNAQA